MITMNFLSIQEWASNNWIKIKTKNRYQEGGEIERSAEYYEGNKVMRKYARNKYRILFIDVKEVKRAYGRNRYWNILPDTGRRWKTGRNNINEAIRWQKK